MPVRHAQRHPATYQVSTVQRGATQHGSGIAIDGEHILTCAHVLRDGGQTYVADNHGNRWWVTAEAVDYDADVAVLHSPRPLSEYVPVADDVPEDLVEAVSYGLTSGPQRSTVRQQRDTAVFGRRARDGDSGGGIVAQYRGPVVTVGVISGTDGRRTFGAPFRAIKRLLTSRRCGKKLRPAPPEPGDTPPAAAPPFDVSVVAETLAPDQPATASWVPLGPNAARLHLGIPRGPQGQSGVAGPPGVRGQDGLKGDPGRDADADRIAVMEKEIAELRKRLDNFTVDVPFEVSPERR